MDEEERDKEQSKVDNLSNNNDLNKPANRFISNNQASNINENQSQKPDNNVPRTNNLNGLENNDQSNLNNNIENNQNYPEVNQEQGNMDNQKPEGTAPKQQNNRKMYNPNNMKQGFGRNQFAKTIGNKDRYKNNAAAAEDRKKKALDQREKARKEKNNPEKKEGNNDASSANKGKGLKDKFNDQKNLLKANKGVHDANAAARKNKMDAAKSKAYQTAHPYEAGKQVLKQKAKEKSTETVKAVVMKAIPKPVLIGIALFACVIVAFLVLCVVFGGSLEDEGYLLSTEYTTEVNYVNSEYWWPVAGDFYIDPDPSVTVIDDGSTEPKSLLISSYYNEYRTATSSYHKGIDINRVGGSASTDTEYYIIASKSGTVYSADNDCATDTTGYGCVIYILHDDGSMTVYGHMADGSLRVEVNDVVVQGQVIGQMGTTGNSSGIHLHFEVRINSIQEDPLLYVSQEDPRATNVTASYSGSGEYSYLLNLNLYETALTKTQFKTKMEEYYATLSGTTKTNFYNNFLLNSDLIYEASVENGINPELVVAYAAKENSFSCSSNNCWGIGQYNGESSGTSYASMSSGISSLATTILKYSNESNSFYSEIVEQKEAATESGCISAEYIIPDTLIWVQSKYSSIGTYMYNPGSSGSGGCYYVEYWVKNGYMGYDVTYDNDIENIEACNSTAPYCSTTNITNCTKSTACEISDYALYEAIVRGRFMINIFYS